MNGVFVVQRVWKMREAGAFESFRSHYSSSTAALKADAFEPE